MNENKFTPTAEEALRLAQEAAGELGHGYVGTEHLLLGLMREDEGMAHTVLTEAGLTDDLLTEMVRKSVGAGLPGGNPAQGLIAHGGEDRLTHVPLQRAGLHQIAEDGSGRSQIHAAAQTVDDVHHQRLPVHLHPGDADISVAAAPALYDVAPLR